MQCSAHWFAGTASYRGCRDRTEHVTLSALRTWAGNKEMLVNFLAASHFEFNLVTSSLSQCSACKISSLLSASCTIYPKYSVSLCLGLIILPLISRFFGMCPPSHRDKTALPCLSTSTFRICRMPGWLPSLAAHISYLPLPEILMYCAEPENRWSDVDTCPYLNLPLPLHVSSYPLCDPWCDYKLCAAERKPVLSLLSVAVVPP